MNKSIYMRLSYTAFYKWNHGDIPGLVDYMRGVPFEPTEQMLEGMRLDDQACKEALDTKMLNPMFGGYKLVRPKAQLYLSAEFTTPKGRKFEMVGKPDIFDAGVDTLYELKTGVMTSFEYAGTDQVPIYALLFEQAKRILVKKAYVCRYDQYFQKTDISKVLLSKALLERTYTKLINQADDICDYLSDAIKESTPRWKIN